MLNNVTAGYRLAWIHRWQLLPVLVAVLVPLLILLRVLELVTAGREAAIIDGMIVFGGRTDPVGVGAAVTGVCWLFALTAGVVVLGGGARSLATAARKLPYLLLGLVVAAGLAIGVIWLAGQVANGLGQPFGPALFFATLAGVTVVGARLLLGVATAVFGGSAWGLTRGRLLRTAGAILLGGFAVPFVVAAAVNAVPLPVITDIVNAVLVVAVVAVQAGILAQVYVSESGMLVAARTDPVRPRPFLGLALLLPALMTAGFVFANPYRLTTVDSNRAGPPGGALAAVWPNGRHPILVADGGGIRYCHDDLCDRYTLRHGGPPVMRGWGTVGIGPNGTVVKASVTGGADNGGPFIHFGQCTEDEGCQGEAWIPIRASSDEPFTWSEIAVSSAPDGALLFALAVPPPAFDQPREDVPEVVEFKLIRCPDPKCAKPERFAIGKVPGALDQGNRNLQRDARLEVGPDGRPVASFRIGHTVQTFTCDPVTCANPRITAAEAGPPDAAWARMGDGTVWLSNGGLRMSSAKRAHLATSAFAERSAALAVSGDEVYVAMAVKAPDPGGLRLTIGKPPEYWQYVVWHCADPACDNPRRIPLDVVKGPPAPVRMTLGDDGRVLVVREDRVMLIPAAATAQSRP